MERNWIDIKRCTPNGLILNKQHKTRPISIIPTPCHRHIRIVYVGVGGMQLVLLKLHGPNVYLARLIVKLVHGTERRDVIWLIAMYGEMLHFFSSENKTAVSNLFIQRDPFLRFLFSIFTVSTGSALTRLSPIITCFTVWLVPNPQIVFWDFL